MVVEKVEGASGVRRHLSVGRLREALVDDVPSDLLNLITGWELLGDIVILELPDKLDSYKSIIGEKVLQLHIHAKSVMNRSAIKGVYREPSVELIAGSNSLTLHRENGCVFRIDPSRVMFSFGNFEERKRMAGIAGKDEVVVDMFSCVGQFSIPLAKHSSPRVVYAVEKNPIAFGFLEENIGLNHLFNMHAIQGDCRDVTHQGVSDRVIMGYLFETISYLPSALSSLKDNGGIIHFHTISRKDAIFDEMEAISEVIDAAGRSVVSLEYHVVKSYAPSVYHYVVDIEVS